MNDVDPEWVLVLRALGLGDLMTGIPGLRGLRRARPDAVITLATSLPLVDLASRACPVDDVLGVDGLAGPLPKGVDMAVNLHGRGPQSTRLLRRTGAASIVAFDTPGHPAWDDREHERQRWCRLVGGCADDLLVAPEGELAHRDGGLVVVHPGASAVARRWPADRWASVAADLAASGRRVVVCGTSGERALVAAVVEAAGLPGSADLAGLTSPVDLLALVASAGLVLSGDSGVAHVAAATATPSVTVFGPTPPARWGPPSHPRHQVLWAGLTGDPHGDRPHAGLLRVTTVEVLEAAGRAVAGNACAECGPRSPPAERTGPFAASLCGQSPPPRAPQPPTPEGPLP